MKRPPGLWLLLSAGVLWLSVQNVYALKATELIFGKTTSTTSTTEIAPEGEQKDGASTSETSDESEKSENSIKSNLTGVPQIDYLFDPNLPRELNGYNLSSYPFYNSMPEDIDFKCDGLHDGFYASVPHKCQVYHHCLFGTRYDFLCANYTAFDQKTFICHFVSEVDCNNSHKYWHRNDALYQAATTTSTAKPPPIVVSPALTAVPRRPSPAVRRPRPTRRRPQYEYYDEEYDEDAVEDDYEEPPPRRRRKRPRPHRRRPVYEDDYEEYEDDRYERRGPGRRGGSDDRKSYDRRESDDRRSSEHDKKEYDARNDRRESESRHKEETDKRSSDKKQSDDRDRPVRDNERDYDRRDSEDRRNREDERRPYDRKETDDRRNREDERKPHERKPYDRRESDDSRVDDYDRRQSDRRDYEDRRHSDGKRYKDDRRYDYDSRYDKDDEDFRHDRDRDRRKENDRKRRPDDDYRDDHQEERRSSQDKRFGGDRRYEKRRPSDDQASYDRPRKTHRRPHDDDFYEDDREDDRRNQNRPRKTESRDEVQTQSQDSKKQEKGEITPLVKPSGSSSVFSQPRMPPRIRPPVPKNEQNKFAYKTTTEKSPPLKPEDEEYYDYEDEPPLPQKRTTPRPTRKPEAESVEPKKPGKIADSERENRRPLGLASRPRIQMSRKPITEPPPDDYVEEKPRPRPHNKPRHEPDIRDSKIGLNSRNRPSIEDDFIEEEAEEEKPLLLSALPGNRERNTNQYTPKFVPKERVRNEFRDRLKSEAISSSTTSTTTTTTTSTTTTAAPPPIKESPRERHEPVVKVLKRPFLPSRGGNPYSARGLQPVGAKALDSSRNPPILQQQSTTSSRPIEYTSNIENDPKPITGIKHSDPPKPSSYDEPRQRYKLISAPVSSNDETTKYRNSGTERSTAVQNGRQFPVPVQDKPKSFLINEQPVDPYKNRPPIQDAPQKASYDTSYKSEPKEPPPPEEKPFKPSPVLIKVPVRLKYSNPINNADDDEEFRPVSNRPQSALRPNKPKTYDDSRTTEKAAVPERNPLDINENEYDVTLNDALNPTIPNLPIRNFPSSFSTDTDYTYSSFHRPRYDVALNQPAEERYQARSPSQRIETVQPYIGEDGKKYTVSPNTQYTSFTPDQIYQNQNFRSSPQITQAQTHAYYSVY